jgi:hypothetical protein
MTIMGDVIERLNKLEEALGIDEMETTRSLITENLESGGE